MGEVKHPLFKCSINDVRKYFEFAVWMSSKPSAGLDPILVDNTQVTEASMAIIIISENDGSISELTLLLYPGKKHYIYNSRGEGESMKCFEPTMVSVAPFSRGPENQLGGGHVQLVSGDWSWRRKASEKSSGWRNRTKGRRAKSEQFDWCRWVWDTSTKNKNGSLLYENLRAPELSNVRSESQAWVDQHGQITQCH